MILAPAVSYGRGVVTGGVLLETGVITNSIQLSLPNTLVHSDYLTSSVGSHHLASDEARDRTGGVPDGRARAVVGPPHDGVNKRAVPSAGTSGVKALEVCFPDERDKPNGRLRRDAVCNRGETESYVARHTKHTNYRFKIVVSSMAYVGLCESGAWCERRVGTGYSCNRPTNATPETVVLVEYPAA